MFGLASRASAHAFTIGYTNAGPGAVTIWLGTYSHGGHHLEGSARLTGALGTVYGPSTILFSLLTCDGDPACRPTGLVDGTNHFYASGPLGGSTPLSNTQTAWLTQNPCCPVTHWQGATFTGLGPGNYQFNYVPIVFPSAEWNRGTQSRRRLQPDRRHPAADFLQLEMFRNLPRLACSA